MNSEICSQTISAGGCLVLAPGLLSGVANVPVTDALLSGSLARLLSFADQIEIPEVDLPSVESLVASALLSDGGESGAAYLTHHADYPNSTRKSGSVMRADPAYQQIDMNNATLGNPLELELTLDECTALQETLNHHFAEDGIRFESNNPHRWYCHFDSPLQVTTNPTSASIGRDVASVRPTGTDARRWRSKLAEVEMLLFEHPVNIARQENNKLPVNTLWLWGEGSPAAVGGVENIAIYSDNFYTDSVATNLGFECNELPGAATTFKSAPKATPKATLVVIDKFTQPNVSQENSQQLSQQDNLQWFDETISSQLWDNLQISGWPEITLWFGDNRLFHLQASVKKQYLRRLFKKSKLLSAYLPDRGFDENMSEPQRPNGQGY